MIISARGKILLILSLLCGGEFAVADEFHYNNMLIGDRAAGMGGAYTAISDDATGLYYNPAGIVYVGDKNFSASVNAYYSQSKKYENVFGNQSFERNSSALLANYFGIVKPFGRYKIGFSYAVPDAVSENQNQVFTNITNLTSRFTINLNNRDSTYNFGPSIATEINDDLSVGITLYAHQRDAQLILNQFVESLDPNTSAPSARWENNYFRINETGIKPILGVSWSPAEKLSLGLSLSKTFVLNSSTSQQVTCYDNSIYDPTNNQATCFNGATAPTLQVPTHSNSGIKRDYPARLALGAAYFSSRDLLVTADWSYHTAVNDPVYGDKVATYNVAFGTEYYLTRKWAVRAGFFTNMSNAQDIQEGVTKIPEQINLYGASLSLSNFSGTSSVTVGGSVNYGKGKSQILSNYSVQNATTLGWLFFLSSSY
ncbi:MAG: outer membrane protein transport protein [Nitrosomonadales bacterium]|nr:outer membrane protein transport protein [Nitrosomonadales bacterium]